MQNNNYFMRLENWNWLATCQPRLQTCLHLSTWAFQGLSLCSNCGNVFVTKVKKVLSSSFTSEFLYDYLFPRITDTNKITEQTLFFVLVCMSVTGGLFVVMQLSEVRPRWEPGPPLAMGVMAGCAVTRRVPGAAASQGPWTPLPPVQVGGFYSSLNCSV